MLIFVLNFLGGPKDPLKLLWNINIKADTAILLVACFIFDQSVVTRRCVLWKRNSITDRGAESWLQLWRRSGMQWDAVVFTKNIWGGCTSARCKNPRLQTVKDSVCWDYCSQFSWVSRATHLRITINYINDLVVVKCQFMSSLSPFDIKSLTRSQINPEFQSQRASKILMTWRNVKIDLIIERYDP